MSMVKVDTSIMEILRKEFNYEKSVNFKYIIILDTEVILLIKNYIINYINKYINIYFIFKRD